VNIDELMNTNRLLNQRWNDLHPVGMHALSHVIASLLHQIEHVLFRA